MAVSNVELRVDARNAVSGLRQVNRASSQLDGAINQLQRSLGGLAASFAGGFALSKIIADVKELDTNLRRLGTVGGNVAALDKSLGALSDRLGGVANKAELAAASYQALSAGFTDTASNIKVVEAATKAAVGGLVDVTSVVEVTTKTLNAYGMSGEQAVKVTDSISKAIEYGQVQWVDYTSQLGRVASIAALAGVSLDEVNAFIAAATKNGATAEVAFTGLGATLATILKPSKESAEAASALGINWTLAGIRGEGFESLMTKLAKAMQENPVLATEMVGGQEAIRGAFAAASKGGKDYQTILEGLGQATGKTDSDFNQLKTSIENQLKALDTAFKNLSEAIGVAFGPAVVDSISQLTGFVNGFADAVSAIPEPVARAIVEVLKLAAQMLVLKKAFEGIIALRLAIVGALTSTTGAITASGVAATTSSSAFALYANNTKTLEAAAASATPKLTALRGILTSLASIGVIAIAVNIAVTGLQNLITAQAEINRLRGQRAAGGQAAIFGGSAPAASQKVARDTLKAIKEERERLNAPGTVIGQTLLGPASGLAGLPTPADRADRLRVLAEREKAAQAIAGLPTRKETALDKPDTTNIVGGGIAGAADSKAAREAERAAEAAAREAARVQEVIRDRLAEGQMIRLNSEMRDRIAAAEAAGDTMLAARLKGAQRELDIQYRYAQELARETDLEAQKAIIFEGQTALVANQRDVQRELNDLQRQSAQQQMDSLQKLIQMQYEQNTAVQQQLQLADSVANTLGEGLASAFGALISGAQSWEESLKSIASGVLVDIANQLIRIFIIEQAINAIKTFLTPFSPSTPLGAGGGRVGRYGTFGPNYGIPQRAMGGSVSGGQPYLVGERGPELFMPGRSGGIAPTGSFGGGVNVVVNVDASGTSVQGDQSQGAALGRVVAAAVQAELIKQKRPGGLLTT
jgi:TP901 family phage tail tape measure protein